MPRNAVTEMGQGIREKYATEKVRHKVVPAHCYALLIEDRARQINGECLAEAGALDALAVIVPFHGHDAAHLMQP